MDWMLLGAGFMMGLLGSPHCLGMCGGIVSAFGISMQQESPAKKSWLVMMYHLGRISSYMLLGVIAASLGATILAPFMTHNSLPRILLGFAIIFAALLMLGLPILKNIEKFGLGLWQKLSPLRQKLFPLTTTPKALGAGLLWGFLPCGLVYGALGVAVGMGTADGNRADVLANIGSGMLFMLAFGLGTMPMLVATQTVVAFLQKIIKKFSLRQASGVLMLLSGLFVAIPAMTHSHHGHGHGHDHSDHGAAHAQHDTHQHNHNAHTASSHNDNTQSDNAHAHSDHGAHEHTQHNHHAHH